MLIGTKNMKVKENQELSDKPIIRKLWKFSDKSHVVTIAPAIVKKLHLDEGEEGEVYFEEKVTKDGCILLKPRRLMG
jgi:hypothetical protein